jgi:hypothetical protein
MERLGTLKITNIGYDQSKSIAEAQFGSMVWVDGKACPLGDVVCEWASDTITVNRSEWEAMKRDAERFECLGNMATRDFEIAAEYQFVGKLKEYVDSMKPSVDAAIKATEENNTNTQEWDEKRLDIVGSNGNNGLHYEAKE